MRPEASGFSSLEQWSYALRGLPPRGHWGVPGGDIYGHTWEVEATTRVEANVAVHTLVTIIRLDEK